MTEERTELEDLREQVRILANSESITLVELTGRYEALLESNAERVKELRLANEALVELKKVDLIGPLTAEEWLEFRLRTEEDEDHELLRCCANTSGIRDAIFILMRSNAEDPVLGRARFSAAWEAFNDHGYEDWSDRARELMDRLHAYYGCGGCTEHEERR